MRKKNYNTEFKETLVSLYESGKTVSELCKEFGVSTASVNRWKRAYGSKKSQNDTKDMEDKKRLRALEKELKDITLERDILKKAVSIFSKSDK